MKKASSGMRPTMGTLSGAEPISQSCRQSISSPRTMWERPPSAVRSSKARRFLSARKTLSSCARRTAEGGCPHKNLLLSRRLWPSPRLVGFFGQHDGGRTRDAAIFSYAPEVHNHQHRGHDRNADAVPYVGAQQRVGIDDRATQQSKADVVVRR